MRKLFQKSITNPLVIRSNFSWSSSSCSCISVFGCPGANGSGGIFAFNSVSSLNILFASVSKSPRFGKVGKQKIEDTGALTKKRMETVDDETSAAAIDFIKRQVAAGKPFFVWWNGTRMHLRTHVRAENRGKYTHGDSEYIRLHVCVCLISYKNIKKIRTFKPIRWVVSGITERNGMFRLSD